MVSWEVLERKKVALFFLHVDLVSVAWSLGLRNLLPRDMPIFPLCGMPYDMARNAACYKTLNDGFQYLFFLDSDVVPPHDAVLRLMSHNLPIVSGVYHRRSPPHGLPVMLRNVNGTGAQWLQNYPPDSLIEVDLVGAGCMLIRRDLLEKMPPQRPGYHWFDWRVNLRDTNTLPPGECMSEDFTFCSAVKKLGYRIMVDTGIQCRHIGLSQATLGKMEPCDTTPVT